METPGEKGAAMGYMGYDPQRLAVLRSRMAEAQRDLSSLRCSDPDAADANRVVTAAMQNLSNLWIPIIDTVLRVDPLSSYQPLDGRAGWNRATDPLGTSGTDVIGARLPATGADVDDVVGRWARSRKSALDAAQPAQLSGSLPLDEYREDSLLFNGIDQFALKERPPNFSQRTFDYLVAESEGLAGCTYVVLTALPDTVLGQPQTYDPFQPSEAVNVIGAGSTLAAIKANPYVGLLGVPSAMQTVADHVYPDSVTEVEVQRNRHATFLDVNFQVIGGLTVSENTGFISVADVETGPPSFAVLTSVGHAS
jgi:hypothetical protein